RPGRRGRHVPGADLARLHGGRRVAQAGARLPRADSRDRVAAARQALLRLHAVHPDVHAAGCADDDRDRDDSDDAHADAPAAGATAQARAEPRAAPAASPPAAPGPSVPAGALGRSGLRLAAVSTATELLTIDQALALVLERVQPLDAEDVPLEDAAG